MSPLVGHRNCCHDDMWAALRPGCLARLRAHGWDGKMDSARREVLSVETARRLRAALMQIDPGAMLDTTAWDKPPACPSADAAAASRLGMHVVTLMVPTSRTKFGAQLALPCDQTVNTKAEPPEPAISLPPALHSVARPQGDEDPSLMIRGPPARAARSPPTRPAPRGDGLRAGTKWTSALPAPRRLGSAPGFVHAGVVALDNPAARDRIEALLHIALPEALISMKEF